MARRARPPPRGRGARGRAARSASAVHVAVPHAREVERDRGVVRAPRSDRRRRRRWCRRRTGRPRRRSRPQASSTAATCSADRAATTASGAASSAPAARPDQVRIALAAAWRSAVFVPGQQPRPPAARVSASGSARALGQRSRRRARRERRAPPRPARPRASLARPGPSSRRLSGSPQPHHFIGSLIPGPATPRPAPGRSRRAPRRGGGALRRASSPSRAVRARAGAPRSRACTSVAPVALGLEPDLDARLASGSARTACRPGPASRRSAGGWCCPKQR